MTKILIIGQAPPIQKQEFPYDTTMFYDWLAECGISKERAQDIFEFEAISGHLRGVNKNGGHLKPLKSDMDKHWDEVLLPKLMNSEKVVLLGNASRDYFNTKNFIPHLKAYEIIHPSKRNVSLFRKNKNDIIITLKMAIYN